MIPRASASAKVNATSRPMPEAAYNHWHVWLAMTHSLWSSLTEDFVLTPVMSATPGTLKGCMANSSDRIGSSFFEWQRFPASRFVTQAGELVLLLGKIRRSSRCFACYLANVTEVAPVAVPLTC